ARLQHIKDIMNAAGVQTLSDLDTLPVTTRTALGRGQVLVAPKKSSVVHVNWANVAKQFRAGDSTARLNILATHLTNQNSTAFLNKLPKQEIVPSARRVRGSTLLHPNPAVATALLRIAPSRKMSEASLHTTETLKVVNNKVTAIDVGLLDNLKSKAPSAWP